MATTTDKRTALYDKHLALGAKMVPFGGFEMPLRYTTDIDEHKAVRERVGVFDVSHMGEFFVRGPEALALIQHVTSNDAAKLTPGQAQYSCLPNETGGIVDDLLVYCMAEDEFMLVVNAANIQKDWDWLQAHNPMGADLEDISDHISLFAVQGPRALEVLQPLTEVKLAEIPYYSFVRGKIAGIDNVILSATGYTGSGGFELYVPNDCALSLWESLFVQGKDAGIQPIGLGARDTLRLEAGYCLYGNDIDDTTSPLEAGLGWITKFTKPFTNSTALAQQKEQGTSRRLTGFLMKERGIPRSGYVILNEAGEEIGKVTSGSQSPMLSAGIGLGYIAKPFNKAGTPIKIRIRNRELAAETVKLPIYKA